MAILVVSLIIKSNIMKVKILTAKSPERSDRVEIDLKSKWAKFYFLEKYALTARLAKENNRGWTFECWLFGTSKATFFYSRGEYEEKTE